MKKYFFAALTLGMAVSFSSCSSDELLVDNVPETEIAEVLNKPYVITDASGNEVNSVDGHFGIYYLQLNTQQPWTVSSDDVFVTVTKTQGVGETKIPIYFGENWQGTDRTGTLKINIGGDKTRATSVETLETTTRLTQRKAISAEDLKKRISSNVAAGYGYRLDGSTLAMNPTIEIFDLTALINDAKYVRDDCYPSAYEEVYTATTRDSLMKALSAGGHFNMKWGGFKLDITGQGGVGHTETHKNEYASKHTSRTYYTREIQWANAIADDTDSKSLFSSGFRYIRDRFVKEINEALTLSDAAKQNKVNALISDFVDNVGSVFVSKSCLGASLDYTISINKEYLADTTTIKAALELGYSKKVKDDTKKDTTATDEKKEEDKKDDTTADDQKKEETENKGGTTEGGEEQKDNENANNEETPHQQGAPAKIMRKDGASETTKRDSINGGASGAYQEKVEKAYEHCEQTLSVFGGDVSTVSVLSNGGTVLLSEFNEWLQSVTPETCVISDMQFVPIYELFSDTTIRQMLRNYLQNKDAFKDATY